MKRMVQMVGGLGKFLLIGAVFFASFALLTLFLSRFLPAQSLMVWGLVMVPYFWVVNRFVLSPLEYHLDFKSLQYDRWYEKRRARKGRTQAVSTADSADGR